MIISNAVARERLDPFILSIWTLVDKNIRVKYFCENYLLRKFHENRRLSLRDILLQALNYLDYFPEFGYNTYVCKNKNLWM